jgi:hypothetical protein
MREIPRALELPNVLRLGQPRATASEVKLFHRRSLNHVLADGAFEFGAGCGVIVQRQHVRGPRLGQRGLGV